jgi:hypothetical protein
LPKVLAWRAARRKKPRPLAESVDRALSRNDQLPSEDQLELRLISDKDVEQQLAAGESPARIIAVALARFRHWQAEEQRLKALQLAAKLEDRTAGENRRVQMLLGFRRLVLDLCRSVATDVAALHEPLDVQRFLERAVERMLADVQKIGGLPT